MQSIEFPSATDDALSPPVRSSYNNSTSDLLKRKLSMLESRSTHAGSAKTQQKLTAFHQGTKSGNYQHHTNPAKPLDVFLQNRQVANNPHSVARSTGGLDALNGHQSDVQRQLEARRKAAAAAQERRAASQREQAAAAANNSAEQRRADQRAEHDAWIDRASTIAQTPRSRQTGYATLSSAAHDSEKAIVDRRRRATHRAEQETLINRAAAARNSTSRPSGHTTLPSATRTRPRPTSPTRSFPKATKQPQSILEKFNADAKRAKERKNREAEARKEQVRASSDDITDSQAQREAEENHAISKPPPYQPLRRINTVPEASHATSNAQPYEPLRTTNTIREPDDDAKSQTDLDDELVLEPSPPPQVPFSLNSAAGIRAIQRSIPRPPPMNLPFDDDVPSRTTAQIFMGTPKTKVLLKKPSRNQDLLPITASDLKLYQWREQKIQWAEVRQLYSDFTGIMPLRSEDSLRNRLRQISKVVEIGVVTEEMCERVINGDEQAAAELNRLAAQYADPSGSSTASSAGVESTPFKKIVAKQTPASRGVTAPPPATPRPTQGGKNIDHDTHIALLLNYADANATEDESSNDSRAGSPLAPEDCIHFEYYMLYRLFQSEDVDNDFGEEEDYEIPWVEHNSSYANAGTANAEASQYVMTVPEGAPEIFKPAEEWELTHKPIADGMSSFNMKTPHGLIQTKVGKRLWSFQEHVMPETKEGWVPKTLYGVFVKRTQRLKRLVKKKQKKKVVAAAVPTTATDEDDLFGEGAEADEEERQEEEEEEVEEEEWYVEVDLDQPDDAVYGSLDQANQEAIKEWVRQTMKPSSANLDDFACRCAAARQELQRRLEEAGEDAVFKKVMEDDEKSVEVFAKALKMKGARN